MIINLGPPFLISGSRHGSFAAGLYDGPVISESTGASRCVQVDLTPLGACRILGMPLGPLAGRTVALDQLLVGHADELAGRLAEAAGTEQRFALLDDVLQARIAASPAPRRELLWAWDELESSGGLRSIGSLGTELGWSRKRMTGCFKEHLGVPPKVVARIIRFERVASLVRREPAISWAQAAFRCGYFDQAHLIHDCRQFTGVTPDVWKGRF
jgi:AraC-like DNA-binding protein